MFFFFLLLSYSLYYSFFIWIYDASLFYGLLSLLYALKKADVSPKIWTQKPAAVHEEVF